MSTYQWFNPNDNEYYDVGTRGREIVKTEGFFDFIKNIPTNLGMIKDITIPTYGLWAGPGYSGGERPINKRTLFSWFNHSY